MIRSSRIELISAPFFGAETWILRAAICEAGTTTLATCFKDEKTRENQKMLKKLTFN
jgi:hypothetical protein